MNEDDIERFEEERELELYREYRDIAGMFTYVVETERRFYLANKVELNQREDGWVEVIHGVSRGQQVATSGLSRLTEGAQVVVRADATPGA